MSPLPTTADTPLRDPSWTAFAAWAVDELGCALAFDGTKYRVEKSFDETNHDADPSASTLRRRWRLRGRVEPATAAPPKPILEVDTPTDLLVGLVQKLAERETLSDLRPGQGPAAVHDLTEPLFAAYTLEGEGQAHVAGCHLEEVPFLRRSRVTQDDQGAPQIEHIYYTQQGDPIDATLAVSLGLDRVCPAREPEPPQGRKLRNQLNQLAKAFAADTTTGGILAELATLVWARRVSGCLRFEFGETSLDVPFEGWARTLVPPPAICPQTGRKTFCLTTTEDCQIAATEEVVACEVTGRRHVRQDLRQCAATGKWVEPEQLTACPITGDPVLDSALCTCERCNQRVSSRACAKGVCQACRELQPVTPDDPRIAKLLAKYPALGQWNQWRFTETDAVWIVQNARRLRRLQWVFDPLTHEPLHAMVSSRWPVSWRPLPNDQQERLLGR